MQAVVQSEVAFVGATRLRRRCNLYWPGDFGGELGMVVVRPGPVAAGELR